MFKHYITHKRGETDADIQDSIDFDVSKQKFAISDGVTQSFLPQIWSKALVQYFVSSDNENLIITKDLLNQFLDAKNHFIQCLNEDERFFQSLVEEEFKNAAATFAGITIKKHTVSWQIIGDSCVFIVLRSNKVRCANIMPNDIDSEGHIIMKFNNHPDYIVSDGTIKGNFIEGSCTIDSGWIAMMTDALSSWFITQYNLGNNPFEKLLQLRDNNSFEDLVEAECKSGRMMSDDASVILIEIPDGDESNTDIHNHLFSTVDYFNNDLTWEELPLWMN